MSVSEYRTKLNNRIMHCYELLYFFATKVSINKRSCYDNMLYVLKML